MYTLKEKSLVLQDRVKTLLPLLKEFDESNKDAELFGLEFLRGGVGSIKKAMDGINELVEDMSKEINDLFEEEEAERKKNEENS